jgi:peptide/nickel transport system substrate-binding protein
MRSHPCLLLASALLTLTCLARQDAPDAAAPDTLTLAVRADVTGFFPNPPIESEAFTIDVNRSLFETLVRFDSGFRLEPGLAERWESPDDRTLPSSRSGQARFSDGSSSPPRDVAASSTQLGARLGVVGVLPGHRIGGSHR